LLGLAGLYRESSRPSSIRAIHFWLFFVQAWLQDDASGIMVPARDTIRPILPIREKYGTGFAMIGLLMVYQNLLNPPVLPWIPQPPAGLLKIGNCGCFLITRELLRKVLRGTNN